MWFPFTGNWESKLKVCAPRYSNGACTIKEKFFGQEIAAGMKLLCHTLICVLSDLVSARTWKKACKHADSLLLCKLFSW